ncbi:MAG: hypothetical protein ACLPN5_09760 [Roseiarcus sp.]
MLRFPTSGAAVLVIALAACRSAAADPECKSLEDFIETEAAGQAKYYDAFTFRKDRRGDNVLLLFKDTTDRGTPPLRWLFLNRPSPDMTDYCVKARGDEFGYFSDKPQLLYAATFGLPGSGQPQCAISTPRAPAPDVMRAYVNRTLGDDVVFRAATAEGEDYQFAINNDQDWIIVHDNADTPRTSCLYDQGNDVFMRFNRTIPAP